MEKKVTTCMITISMPVIERTFIDNVEKQRILEFLKTYIEACIALDTPMNITIDPTLTYLGIADKKKSKKAKGKKNN